MEYEANLLTAILLVPRQAALIKRRHSQHEPALPH